MYDEQLEKLIEIGIKDGVLTETERRVIVNKAIKLGIDEDEIMMVLEHRLEEKKMSMGIHNQQEAPSPSKSRGHKCPDCGAAHTLGVRLCPDCGHKFPSPAEELANELLIAADSIKASKSKSNNNPEMSFNSAMGYIKRKGLIGALCTLIEGDDSDDASQIDDVQVKILVGFPTPEDRDDLLELIEFIHDKNQYYEFGDPGLTKEKKLIAVALSKFSDNREITKRLRNYQNRIKEELDF